MDVTREGITAARELGRMESLFQLPVLTVEKIAESTSSLLKIAAKDERRGQTEEAAFSYLKAAIEARNIIFERGRIAGSEAERTLFQLHNASLAKFAEIWIDDLHRSGPAPLRLSNGSEDFEIILDHSSDYDPDFFDEAVSADAISGKGVSDIERKGYGAPLVGIRRKTPERDRAMRFFPPQGLHMPLTLTIESVSKASSSRSRRTVVSLALKDPLSHESVTIEERRLPLAANFSAPVLMLLSGRNEKVEGFFGFLNAKKRARESGIYLLEPYDPDRIPVVLTHGLISVPIIWREIIPELMAEPDISSKYQVMAFTYPSSYAIVESAELFRDELKAVREKYDPSGRDPLSRNMLAIGHSMGGVLTHMLVTDFDNRIWEEISDIPFDEFPFNEANKKAIHQMTFFDYDKAVNRAVFISTPHRGANMANSGFAGAVSRLVSLPNNILTRTTAILQGAAPDRLKIDTRKKYTSIQSLQPGSPVLLALDKSPFKPGVIYHSIIGDLGKGDSPDSSDGLVNYWSSHLDGATSELIVPTNHSAYKDPNAIEELKQILRVHAGLQ